MTQETQTPSTEPIILTPPTEVFAETATAAKLSGQYNQAAGYLKRKLGEVTGDPTLAASGRNQQLLGKIHLLVGSVRGVREAVVQKISATRVEGLASCRKHGEKLVELATEFVEDLKKVLFKK